MRAKLIEKLVTEELTNDPNTRGDDYLLMLGVLAHFINPSMPLDQAFSNHVFYKMPSLASIVRIRRKIQFNNPMLRDNQADELRKEEKETYREYAKQ